MRRAQGVRLSDVARAAGVSVGTVSKALNGSGQLSEATRERVAKAATELGFRPNLTARSLVTGRSFMVGVLSDDSYGRFTIPIVTGAEDAFGPGEISILLAEVRRDPIREQHYLDTLLDRRVDGLIVAGRSSNPRPSINTRTKVPTVYALAPSMDAADVSVVPEDKAGAEQAIDHLAAIGKKRIAVVMGPRSHVASRRRVEGAGNALQISGLEFVLGDALYGEWSERWGYEAAGRLLSRSTFDAVYCGSDQIARGVIDCLRDRGVDVPNEVGVIGVDNWTVMTNASRPPITSLDLNLRDIGRRAAELLTKMISGEDIPGGTYPVECTLVRRQST